MAALKRQKELKAKVNATIRAIAKAQKEERLMRNQTNLKVICNEEIREGVVLHRHPTREVQPKQMQMSQENKETDDSVPTWPDTMSDDSENFISDEGIAIMKLVESVTRVSETREKQ